MNKDRFNIGKAYVNIVDPTHTRHQIDMALDDGVNGYISVSNMRIVAIGSKDEEYCLFMVNLYMNIPDGMPLVWCGRIWGCKDAQGSSGHNLFMKMMDEDNKFKSFLLGDTDDTLAKIRAMIDGSGTNIVGTSPRAPKQNILGVRNSEYGKHPIAF